MHNSLTARVDAPAEVTTGIDLFAAASSEMHIYVSKGCPCTFDNGKDWMLSI